jgi:hypothetical protein
LSETTYNDVGRWQQLRLADMSLLLARQVRALRMQPGGASIDEREAYVDAIRLNIYGGQGVTNVWIDDLDIAGYVNPTVAPTAAVATPSPRIGNMPTNITGANPFQQQSPANIAKRFNIKLSVSVLSVDGRPIFPRAIEYQGEPLLKLKELGFNAVWFKFPPPPDILEEADRLGLWLICPPPRPLRTDGTEDPEGTIQPISPAFDRVLLWNLGYNLTVDQLPGARRWADQLRIADRRVARPLICKPLGDLRSFSQVGTNDMTLLVDRRPLGSSMELKDYGTWVSRQPWVALPGTPLWTTVQNQPNEALRAQLAALDPNTAPPACVSYEQMKLLAYTSIAAGSRGLMFPSSSRLDAEDPETRRRAMSLELLNLELALIEPWAAAGNLWDKAESSDPQISGTVLRVNHARLLLPIWSSPGAQCVPDQSAENNVSFIVPAVPDDYKAFRMLPGSLQKMLDPRVRGGKQISFEEFSLASQVLLANDAGTVGGIMRRSEVIAQRAALLQRDLAVLKYNTATAAMKQLGQSAASAKQLELWRDSAWKNLQSCNAYFSSRDYSAASQYADRAMRAVRMIERFYWDEAANNDAARRSGISPATSPATLSFETLVQHQRLLARIRGSQGPNVLPGGNFDDPNLLMQSGWQNVPNQSPGLDPNGQPLVQTAADLVSEAAHSGPFGLRLLAFPTTPENPPMMVETPPMRFVSPTVPAQVGQLVCIHGWVKVQKAIDASVDGLMIYDNQGGDALADRIGQTADWRPFVLYRLVTQPGGVNVTFSLTGLGQTFLDDVGIEVLQ